MFDKITGKKSLTIVELNCTDGLFAKKVLAICPNVKYVGYTNNFGLIDPSVDSLKGITITNSLTYIDKMIVGDNLIVTGSSADIQDYSGFFPHSLVEMRCIERDELLLILELAAIVGELL